jgi:hypothetical protein
LFFDNGLAFCYLAEALAEAEVLAEDIRHNLHHRHPSDSLQILKTKVKN